MKLIIRQKKDLIKTKKNKMDSKILDIINQIREDKGLEKLKK